jgi:hypothetical protein
MMRRPTVFRTALQSFSPRRFPPMTRQSYAHELVNALTFPAALSMVQGGVVGVLAEKAFNVSPPVFATIMAAEMFGNLSSFLWAKLSHGRPKVRFINLMQIGALGCVAGIALLPTTPAGGVALMLLVTVCRCLLSGVITLRSTVWRMNYPRRVRAQITGKLAILQSLIGAVAPLAGYAALDVDPSWFRVIYPASVVVAALGVLNFSRIRLRRERELLAYETAGTTKAARPATDDDGEAVYEGRGDTQAPATTANMWTVLRDDVPFRRYMTWQYVAGIGNMMGEVVIVSAIADATRGLPAEWFTAICLTTAVPMLLAVVTLPAWSRMLDRIHIADFRARQGWWWASNQALHWAAFAAFAAGAGAAWGAWAGFAVLALSRVVQGVARGAGMLAWNLGHNDFADRRMVAVYMSIHVTLTGVRGATGPFLAIALYNGWRPVPWLGIDGWSGIGHHVFLLTTALTIWSERGFSALARDLQANNGQGKVVPAD